LRLNPSRRTPSIAVAHALADSKSRRALMIRPGLQLPPFIAKRYLRWKSPAEIAACPDLLIAQIMNIGTWDDVVALEDSAPDGQLRHVLTEAQPGQYSERTWQFWHLRLHLADIDKMPPPPQRSFAAGPASCGW
jgi:hypothetical protein